jgi:hypothetical protein
MKMVLLLFIIIFTTSCVFNDPNTTYTPNLKEVLANQISKEVAIQLKKDKELYPCGFGGGTSDKIRMLALSFNYYKEIEIKEARELLMTAGNLFVNKINDNERVRPYLKNYPFMLKNIELRIFLQNKNGSEFGADKLSAISMIEGILEYDIRSPDTHLFTTIYTETFEEAIEKTAIVNSEEIPSVK